MSDLNTGETIYGYEVVEITDIYIVLHKPGFGYLTLSMDLIRELASRTGS